MKYIFPLLRNISNESETVGYPLRLEVVAESKSEAIHEAIKILQLQPEYGKDNYEGDLYKSIYDSFDLDITKLIRPLNN